MQTRNRLLGVVLASVLLAALVYAGAALGEGKAKVSNPNELVVSRVALSDENKASLWTEERMAAARPVPLAVIEGEPKGMSNAQPISAGPEFSAPAVAPKPEAAEALAQALGRPVPQVIIHEGESEDAVVYGVSGGTELLQTGWGSPFPSAFSRYPWAGEPTKFPYIMVGKAFFHNPATNEDLVCSAGVMRNRTVWTAGRCVYDPDNDVFMTDWVFVPGFRVGNDPYGTWTASTLTALNGWVADGDPRFDLGAAALNDLGGQKISDVVGSFGFIANTGWRKHWHALGYPDNAPFAGFVGGRVMQCASDSWIRDTTYGASQEPVGMGCDMEGGHVGGPWVFRFQFYPAATMNQVNGISTYRYTSDPFTQYSPYFGDGAINLWNWGASQ